MSESSVELARRIVAENRYLTLATADADGRPWATPVWFAVDGLREFIWASKPGARHSQNIAVRADVGIVVYDSTVVSSDAAAVYVEARAGVISSAERAEALAIYNARSASMGLRQWTEADVIGTAKHRLYRAVAGRTYVLDEHDQRILLD